MNVAAIYMHIKMLFQCGNWWNNFYKALSSTYLQVSISQKLSSCLGTFTYFIIVSLKTTTDDNYMVLNLRNFTHFMMALWSIYIMRTYKILVYRGMWSMKSTRHENYYIILLWQQDIQRFDTIANFFQLSYNDYSYILYVYTFHLVYITAITNAVLYQISNCCSFKLLAECVYFIKCPWTCNECICIMLSSEYI